MSSRKPVAGSRSRQQQQLKPQCPFERPSDMLLCHEIFARLQEAHARAAPYFQKCPILQDTPSTPVLASDGYVYDLESLRHWMETCVAKGEPVQSPMSRVCMRTFVYPISLQDAAKDSVLSSSPTRSFSSPTRSFSSPTRSCHHQLRAAHRRHRQPPQPIHLIQTPHPSVYLNVRSGSARCSRWNTRCGVGVRMILDWMEEDIVDWVFPCDTTTSPCTIMTPPPAAQLVPIAKDVARWLCLSHKEYANPTHIMTAYFSLRNRAGQGETLEMLLLGLASR